MHDGAWALHGYHHRLGVYQMVNGPRPVLNLLQHDGLSETQAGEAGDRLPDSHPSRGCLGALTKEDGLGIDPLDRHRPTRILGMEQDVPAGVQRADFSRFMEENDVARWPGKRDLRTVLPHSHD